MCRSWSCERFLHTRAAMSHLCSGLKTDVNMEINEAGRVSASHCWCLNERGPEHEKTAGEKLQLRGTKSNSLMFSGLFSEKVDSKLYQPPHLLHGASKRWCVIWKTAAKPLKTPIEWNEMLLLRKVQASCWILLHFVRYQQAHCDASKRLVGPLLAGCSMAHKPLPLQFSQSPLPPR